MKSSKNGCDLLRRFTHNERVVEELAAYTRNRFSCKLIEARSLIHLQEEPQLEAWEQYLADASRLGAYAVLKKIWVPLQFPIRKNISQSSAYRRASLQGKPAQHLAEATGLTLAAPEELELRLYAGIAGKIPVLVVPHAGDFERLIQALAYKNEPVDIPPTMGASIIKGLNNWDRIDRMRQQWQAQQPGKDWAAYFRQEILPHKNLYQDKFMVLSKKPYSGVAACQLGLSPQQWLDDSLHIRLEHECAHDFTLRYLGGMYANMHDELIADYMGITRVRGYFDAHWFLSFIGLAGKTYREGSRLENYAGIPRLSAAAFEVLQSLLRACAENLAAFCHKATPGQARLDRMAQLMSLASLSLEEMAAPGGEQRLRTSYERLLHTFGQAATRS